MIVHVAIADAIENDHKSVMILTAFALFFFFASFSPSILEPRGTGLFKLEGILVVLKGKKTQHPSTYLFAKALVPSKSMFLPALTVRDTTSFSAGHGIANRGLFCMSMRDR